MPKMEKRWCQSNFILDFSVNSCVSEESRLLTVTCSSSLRLFFLLPKLGMIRFRFKFYFDALFTDFISRQKCQIS